MRKITILQGHPDNDPARLCRALAAAYAEGARAGGHSVKEVDIARLDVPFLRTQNDFELGLMPEGLAEAGEALAWADHVVLVFPLWLGTLPALAKAFLEQVLRPGTAFRYNDGGVPEKLLTGRSVRIVVTMGMPAFVYRWWYGAHGLRGLERNILSFVGLGPIRRSLFGGVGTANEEKRRLWLARMASLGREGR